MQRCRVAADMEVLSAEEGVHRRWYRYGVADVLVQVQKQKQVQVQVQVQSWKCRGACVLWRRGAVVHV